MNFLTVAVCFSIVVLQMSQAAKLSRPVTLLTQLNVQEADPDKTQFLQLGTGDDGQPVGIIVKRRSEDRKRQARDVEDEIIEIIGIRMPDDISDRTNVYRNAKIINNKLVMNKIKT